MSEEQTVDNQTEPTIGLADIHNAVKIIDHACEQGAFKGWSTIEQVQSVRSRLQSFLAANLPPEVVDAKDAKTVTGEAE